MTRGVNLGGWLVLERWITPSVFGELSARDERTLCRDLGGQAASILSLHRRNFITEADFEWIAGHGLNAIRLPIGYWLFGDEPPFVGCIEYVDKAFEWAKAHGLGILLDLHAAPGSQNGHDHSGAIGDISWNELDNITKSLKVVERLAERYKGNSSLIGIELLNEPSWLNRKKHIRKYYEDGYEAVRRQCGTNVAVVVSDAYHPFRWKHVMQNDKYQNKQLDVHLYQLFSSRDKKLSLAGHINKTVQEWSKLIAKVSKHWPIIIGEWSVALDEQTFNGYDKSAKDAANRLYAAAQLAVFEHAAGWFYWTYKAEQGGPWSYRDCVYKGWLPARY